MLAPGAAPGAVPAAASDLLVVGTHVEARYYQTCYFLLIMRWILHALSWCVTMPIYLSHQVWWWRRVVWRGCLGCEWQRLRPQL